MEVLIIIIIIGLVVYYLLKSNISSQSTALHNFEKNNLNDYDNQSKTTKKVMTPEGISYNCFTSFLSQAHLLIAGATGSGKSTLINGLIWQALYFAPNHSSRGIGFILIDPNKVELNRYKDLPHTINYATSRQDINSVLDYAIEEIKRRCIYMEKKSLRKYDGNNIYIVIDEFADISTDKNISSKISKIAMLGRPANIHLWLCTQRPTAEVINGQIRANLDARIALHCSHPQDSVNIINQKGAERLPIGKALYTCAQCPSPILVDIPYISEDELNNRVSHWMNAM